MSERESHPVPDPNRIPRNVADDIPTIVSMGYHVGSWTPELDGKGPLEAVVLRMDCEMDGLEFGVGMRIKSCKEMNRLIAALERHRDDVWPEGA